MIIEIGIVAGEIWHFLENRPNKESLLSEMINCLGRPRELVLMSVGWLGREGHVVISGDQDYKITLRR
ncbi:MAG: winged helix-turn-helix domain-containing protein [Candidatus Omnitrophica bacterium]|nr:winged helix-turn-helix domain-containing protein [Candidatus Omnitrophota bacterium]